MRAFIFICVLLNFIMADSKLELNGNIAVLKDVGGEIFAGTDVGNLYKISEHNANLILSLPKVKTHCDEDVDSKIVDMDKISSKIAVLFDGDFLEKKLGIYENSEFQTHELPITGIKRIYFYDENSVILISVGSEILYYDLKSRQVTFQEKFTISPTGGVFLDRDQDILLLSCEGGIIFFFDINTKKLLNEKSIQKDNIFSVAMHKNRIISGSNDKTCYYENANLKRYFEAGFLVYSVALNDNFGAFSALDSVKVINANGDIVKSIPHDGEILNYLIFKDDKILGAGYDKTVHFWSYKWIFQAW